MFRHVQPGENEETVTVDRTREEAVALLKQSADSKGYTYSSDEDALADYIAVHWTWEVKEDGQDNN